MAGQPDRRSRGEPGCSGQPDGASQGEPVHPGQPNRAIKGEQWHLGQPDPARGRAMAPGSNQPGQGRCVGRLPRSIEPERASQGALLVAQIEHVCCALALAASLFWGKSILILRHICIRLSFKTIKKYQRPGHFTLSKSIISSTSPPI